MLLAYFSLYSSKDFICRFVLIVQFVGV